MDWETTTLGLISDTHGFLDPCIRSLFQETDHILHAGDVGNHRIIHELEKIAPVTSVSGNVDVGLPYPDFAYHRMGEDLIYIQHIVNPGSLDAATSDRLEKSRPKVVLFGHTHKPYNEWIGDRLYVNPGYAGKKRFGLSRSVALLRLDTDGFKVEFHEL